MKAIRIHKYGGPEVMKLEDVPVPSLAESQVLVRQHAIGVNYIDTYHRTGLYPLPLPFTLGVEGAGVVEQVGQKVEKLKRGDRIAYVGVTGTYAEYVAVPENRAILIPDGVNFQQAAAVMLQGMTAHYLVYSTFPLQSGQSCLVHAGAGGVGLLLVQMAQKIGARIFATVSTDDKAKLATRAGADRVILYTREDFQQVVLQETDGRGVHVVYDSVGKDTFEQSLNCLAPLGYLVLFGQSSGKVPPFDPSVLAAKGSLFLTRPSLFDYIRDRKSLEWRAHEVLHRVLTDELKLHIGARFSLADAVEAHRKLQGRQTTGKVLLNPRMD